MRNVNLRRGQVWYCGPWGFARITRLDRPSKQRPGVDLEVLVGGQNTHKGERIGLQRVDFENGTYHRFESPFDLQPLKRDVGDAWLANADHPWPEWALTAKAAGWTPPEGWKP